MAKKTENKMPDPTATLTEMMNQWQSMGLGAMQQMGTGWFEAMSEMGSEWLHFVSERVQKDVDFQHRLLHAKTPQEVHAVQAEFMQGALDDYTAETGKMVEMSQKLFEPPKTD